MFKRRFPVSVFDKNRHFVLLIIDISKHGAKEMSHVKMAGPGFVNDVTA
jgi:hypothetical protein